MISRLVHRLERRHDDERGAYAILMSMMLVLIIALAAIAIDVAKQVESKQSLRDTMDAAAHAAVFELTGGSPTQAVAVAREAATRNGYDGPLAASSFCVVASTGAMKTPVYSQIPGMCNPGGSAPYANTKCDEALCFIPCTPVTGNAAIKCNTIRLAAAREVDYDFAPAIGYDRGSTGTVVSVACKGACGTVAPNPMDVVVVADRTQSLSSSNRSAMVSAIQGMMREMDPTMHFLSIATIDKSRAVTGNSCPSSPRTSSGSSTDSWLASQFSNTYSRRNETTGRWDLSTTDKSAYAVSCLGSSEASWGTHLAAPLKAAARTLLGVSSSNLINLNAANPRPGTPRKVIIFETDGEPNEKSETVDGIQVPGSAALTVRGEGEPAHSNGPVACENFVKLAEDVKREGILLITIGFGGAATSTCDAWNGVGGGNSGYYSCDRTTSVNPEPRNMRTYPNTRDGNARFATAKAEYNYWTQFCPSRLVRDVLAEAASPVAEGVPTEAQDCATAAGREIENSDGDFFFCGVNGSEFASIFQTAFGQLSTGVKLLKMPA